MPMSFASARRLVVAGGFAIVLAAAPAVTLIGIPTAAAACPAGETEDLYTDNCVPEMSPNVAGGAWPTPGEAKPPGAGVPQDQLPLPEVDGVPCAGNNLQQCIGLEESQGGAPAQPHSSLSSSP